MKYIILPVLIICSLASQTKGVILLEEQFDGLSLPPSFDYTYDVNFQDWRIDANQLYANRSLANSRAMTAISQQTFMLSDDLIYSADMGRPLNISPGGSNVSLIFGDYLATFHPGLGAFRLEKGILDPDPLTPNVDMGFVPALEAKHRVQASVKMENDNLQIFVEINGVGSDQQNHLFEFSFIDNTPALGNGSIGVRLSRFNTDDAFFDNLMVQESNFPEPSILCILLTMLVCFAGKRTQLRNLSRK